ncbi:TPA: hypothetical protein HA369_01705 [Candidatus Woesearchaeota archaeon]|nr:hypothetical protein [Candidatus Woesearchaeota archaeon]
MEKKITISPKEDYQQYLTPAKHITPDENDTEYFALALKLSCPIWSNDKRLKNQEKIRIFSTTELLHYMKVL